MGQRFVFAPFLLFYYFSSMFSSCLRRICEQDDIPSRAMILYVCNCYIGDEQSDGYVNDDEIVRRFCFLLNDLLTFILSNCY
jgi:hypothetical protein